MNTRFMPRLWAALQSPQPEDPPGRAIMKPRRLLLITAIVAIASLGGASVTTAHTLVDPTTLTPPLKPFRVCYEDGPWVKCDTSDPTTTYANQPGDDFGLP